MKIIGTFGLAVLASFTLMQSAGARGGGHSGGGGHFGGGAHYSGGGAHYSGGGAHYSGGGAHYSGGRSFSGGGRYYGGPRVSPGTTALRNPTYNGGGRQYGGNRTGAYAGNRTTAYNSVATGQNRHGNYRTGNGRSSGFNNQRVVARHSANQHPNWSRNHDHNWHGHRCHFHNGFWYVYDPFPWYGYGYPYYWDYYPYAASYDPGYYDEGASTEGAYQEDRQYSRNEHVDGSQVTAVQRALSREGYYDGAIDGVLGPGTRRALRNYARDKGLDASGGITQSVIESLHLR